MNKNQTSSLAIAQPSALALPGLPDFTKDEYRDQSATLPSLITLRSDGTKDRKYGLFLKAPDAASIGLTTNREPTNVVHNDQTTSEGWLFDKDFGMCVQPMTPLLAIDKAASKTQKMTVFAGPWSAALHKDKERYTTSVVYHVLLTDGAGKLLHHKPLKFVPKGATSATINRVWRSAVEETTTLYLKTRGQSYRALSWQFNRAVIVYFDLSIELAGSGQRSEALVFSGYEHPTEDALSRFIVNGDDYKVVDGVLRPIKNDQMLIMNNPEEQDFLVEV